jgi:hypothetical protein
LEIYKRTMFPKEKSGNTPPSILDDLSRLNW